MKSPRMKLDRRVAPLVRALNRMPGIETTGSCQGQQDHRLPYVSFVCGETAIWPILKAVNLLNSREPQQVRAHAETMAYGGKRLDVVLRFHHPIVKVEPEAATVREWHRRIREMTNLIQAEAESGMLSTLETDLAFGEPIPCLRLKCRTWSGAIDSSIKRTG